MGDALKVENSANFALSFIESPGQCRIRSLSRPSSGNDTYAGTQRNRERPISDQRLKGTKTFAEKVTLAEPDSICEPEDDSSGPRPRGRD